MHILAAIKREEKKLEKQLSKLQHQLNEIRSAAKALGHSTTVEAKGVKKRVLSASAALDFLWGVDTRPIPGDSHYHRDESVANLTLTRMSPMIGHFSDRS
jgi:hypothetical protein